jgi:hypothetical protein
MNSRTVALWAAVAAATAWTAKSVSISVAGGLDRSPLEGPLFFLGLACFVVAVVALGIALTAGLATWVRVAAGVGAFAVGFALTLAVDTAVQAFRAPGVERHWVWSEVNLWVVAVVALTVAVALRRDRLRPVRR